MPRRARSCGDYGCVLKACPGNLWLVEILPDLKSFGKNHHHLEDKVVLCKTGFVEVFGTKSPSLLFVGETQGVGLLQCCRSDEKG